MEVVLETLNNQREVLEALRASDDRELDYPISFPEVALFRVSVDHSSTTIKVYLGSLQLTEYEVSGIRYFGLDGPNENGFHRLFLNSVGKINLCVSCTECGSLEFTFEIYSAKASPKMIEDWLEKVSEVFPIIRLSPLTSPLSYLDADFTKDKNYLSLATIIKETSTLLTGISNSTKDSGYLRFQVQQSGDDVLGTPGRTRNIREFIQGRARWKRVPLTTYSIVRKNLNSYEPITLPKTRLEKNYDNSLNQRLMYELRELLETLDEFSIAIGIQNHDELELRNQFQAKVTRSNLLIFFASKIKRLKDQVLVLIQYLETLGVKVRRVINENPDSRFPRVSADIVALERLKLPFRKISKYGGLLLGLPSTDYLFEFYCFALLVETLSGDGFSIVATGEEAPLPFFVRLIRQRDGSEITIFYDQAVPKIDGGYKFHPLVDTHRTGALKRPDFLIHFRNGDIEQVVIMDAKYKRLKKCFKDHFSHKLNADNLGAKYSTYFSTDRNYGLSPIYVGAICLTDEDNDQSSYTSPLHPDCSFLGKAASFRQYGCLALGINPREALSSLINDLLQHISNAKEVNIAITNPEYNTPVITSKSYYISRYPRGFNSGSYGDKKHHPVTHQNAPTLTREDAELIKGMLERGDKPQDIAFYFGVNNGRISEIKSGDKFENVSATSKNLLPPKGPYPALKEVLSQPFFPME